MSDFESYLERYQEVMSDFRMQYLQSYNSMSLFNSKEIRALLHDDEVPRFSAMLFATNLLSQVVHFYGGKVFGLSPQLDSRVSPFDWEVKVNTFPKIYGILGFYGVHICPAVMPTFILKNIDVEVGPWSNKAEKDCWIEYQPYFDESINWAESSITKLLFILLNRDAGVTAELEVVKRLRSEHLSISEQIISMKNHSRIKNSWN
jgi:hypothetical protein